MVAVAIAVPAAGAWLAWSPADPPSGPAAAAADATPRSGTVLSLPEWLAGHSTDWRVGRLRENPDVVVIEFPTLAEQGHAMNRIAALLEKRDAPRDRVLDDRELAALIERGGDVAATFYQGHDYGGDEVARFFGLVAAQRLPLNPAERRLLDVLLRVGALAPAGATSAAGAVGSYRSPGTQAVISYTGVQADDPATTPDETVDERRRESVLLHEASHGRFHTHPAYREHCRDFWNRVLTPAQRDAVRRHLATLGYDAGNEALMIDEAQAFLMHTADTRAFAAADVGLTALELDALRDRFWRTLPADDAAAAAAAAAGRAVTATARPTPATAARP